MSVGTVRRMVGRPSRMAITAIATLLLAQLALLGIYVSAFSPQLSDFHFYPIIWITVSAWVVWHVRPAPAGGRRRILAAGGGVLYFVLLAYLGGLFSIEPGVAAVATEGFRLEARAPPGWSPALFYSGTTLSIALIPYLLIGYLTLAYLVYATILDAWAASAPGLLGIFGCIGCSWPIFASLVGGAGGVAGSLATAVYTHAYPLSTIAFLIAVALLYWRPTYGSVPWGRRG